MEELNRWQKAALIASNKKSTIAHEKYYNNPKFCLYCETMILVPENKRPSYIREKKFCNQSCAAKFNNNGKVKNLEAIRFVTQLEYEKNPKLCEICKNAISFKVSVVKTLKRTYCSNKCRAKIRQKNKPDKFTYLLGVTKKELLVKLKNYISYRATVRKQSHYIFNEKYNKQSCYICGYNKHVEVCHIKSVSSFSDDSLISEINDLSNLVGLCPNHHWEFDNGLIKLTDKM